jgi:hypothetical protein
LKFSALKIGVQFVTMKLIVLAVVLAVVQTSPPVPRKASNNSAGTGNKVQDQSRTENNPTPPNAVVNGDMQGQPSNWDATKHDGDNTEHSIRVRELPPVSIMKDWADWAVWIFSALLVIVGGLQVWLLRGTLRAIQRQADQMEGQLESQREKDRGRLKIEVDNASFASQSANSSGFHAVSCNVYNHGASVANLDEFRVKYIVLPTAEAKADYATCQLVAYAESIEPKGRLPKIPLVRLEPLVAMTDNDVRSIQKGESFVHFFGVARYRDIFKRKRRSTIHMRWKMRWGG